MRCPKCESENINVQFVSTGMKTKNYSVGFGGKMHNLGRGALAVGTFGISNLFVRKRGGEEETSMSSEKMFICQSCGYSSTFEREFKPRPRDMVEKEEEKLSLDDPIVRKAAEISIKKGKFSTALLQTYLGKGHGYVTTIAMLFEESGVIGPQNGWKPREVLIGSMEEYDKLVEKNKKKEEK